MSGEWDPYYRMEYEQRRLMEDPFFRFERERIECNCNYEDVGRFAVWYSVY